MIAAKGRLPDNAPHDTLDGAKMAQTMMSTIVERTTVTKLLATGRSDMLLQLERFGALYVAWLITSLWQDFRGAEFVPRIGEGVD